MRAVYFLAALVIVFLLGAYAEQTYGFPFGFFARPIMAVGPAVSPVDNGNTAIPRYSNARGAEDAPRADVPQGSRTDFQRCVNTMVMRREPESEARTVCQKIISGIGG